MPLILAPELRGALGAFRACLGPPGPTQWAWGPHSRAIYFAMVILGGVRFLNFLDQMSVAKVMRSSTLALFTLLAAARMHKSAEVQESL